MRAGKGCLHAPAASCVWFVTEKWLNPGSVKIKGKASETIRAHAPLRQKLGRGTRLGQAIAGKRHCGRVESGIQSHAVFWGSASGTKRGSGRAARPCPVASPDRLCRRSKHAKPRAYRSSVFLLAGRVILAVVMCKAGGLPHRYCEFRLYADGAPQSAILNRKQSGCNG